MLIIQYNCRYGYKNIVIALKTVVTIKAGIVILQEPSIYNQEFFYSAFNFIGRREKHQR